MPIVREKVLKKVAEIVYREGERLALNAGHAGLMHDNGGQSLIDQANAFLAGLEFRIPPGWDIYLQQAEKMFDPEYEEFMRLKAKFGE